VKQYKGIQYSIQKLPEGLHILIDLGGPFKNKMITLKSNNEKEVRNIIDNYLKIKHDI